MATKPSSVVRWADAGGAIVEPTSGKKDVGWVAAERPPAQFLNWIQNLEGQWQSYLSDGVLDGKFGVRGTLSPASFSGTQNDFNPTNLSTAAFLRLTVSAAATINGIAGGEAGRMLWLVNIATDQVITLAHEAGGSTAAMRLALPGGANPGTVQLGPLQAALLRYDETSSRWRLVAHTGAGEELWLGSADGVVYTSTGGDPHLPGDQWNSLPAVDEFEVVWPLRLPVGTVLTGVTVYGRAGNSAGEGLEVTLEYTTTTGTLVGVVTKTSALAGGDTTVSMAIGDTGFTAPGHVVAASRGYRLRIPFPLCSDPAEIRMYLIKLNYLRAR